MNAKNKIGAFILTVFIQLRIAGIAVVGGLLDPLIGLWMVRIYFFLISSFFMYSYLVTKFNNFS